MVNPTGLFYKICPRCQNRYTGFSALSRRDNATEICPECGQEEAIVDFIHSIGGNIPIYAQDKEERLKNLIDSKR